MEITVFYVFLFYDDDDVCEICITSNNAALCLL